VAGTGRVDYLDGIRAIAIGAVLSLHWLSWYSPLFHGGSIGVDAFFVLSGFIITTMLWRAPVPTGLLGAWWLFVKRRVVRLYPALLGLVLVAVVLYAVTPDAPVNPVLVAKRGLIALGQVSALWAAGSGDGLWMPGLNPFGQTWSLAIEWYFYLLWPLLVLGARMRGAKPRTLAIGSLVAAVPLYALSLPLNDAWFYFGPATRFAELLVGGALALWFAAGGAPTRPWRRATPVSVLCLVAIGGYCLLAPNAFSPVYRYVGIPGTVLATVLLIYIGYSNQGGPAHRLLGHRWVASVGRYSYSLYLWHMIPILLLEDRWLPLPTPVLGLIAVTATVLMTMLSYRFLERPFLGTRSDVLKPLRPGREHAEVRQDRDQVVG
jgi:peptidoglycan/LPS O-acetylase OafA/YrhL